MTQLLNKCRLSGFQLKVIAMLSMMIDHMGFVLFKGQIWLRCIGRLAFPIYTFLLVEGFIYTSSREKYMIRLFIFALISEVFFDLAFFGKMCEMKHQNVFFTLFIGFLMLYISEMTVSFSAKYIIFLVAMMTAVLIKTDYSCGGVAIIYFYYNYRDRKITCSILQAIIHCLAYGGVQCFAICAFPLIYLYNEERGRYGKKFLTKYFFYEFYPVHLLALYLIASIIVLN